MQHFYMLKIFIANQSFDIMKWQTGVKNTAKQGFNTKLYLNSASKWIPVVGKEQYSKKDKIKENKNPATE